jgi:hypothetical protein
MTSEISYESKTLTPEQEAMLGEFTRRTWSDFLQEFDGYSDERQRRDALSRAAKAAYFLGDTPRACKLAEESLSVADSLKGTWSYGNAIHDANLVLGLVALDGEDVDRAESCLLAAGATPGSPNLNSFGPNTTLAKRLLDLGRVDSVLRYLEACKAFWECGKLSLENWPILIRAGKSPSLMVNMYY